MMLDISDDTERDLFKRMQSHDQIMALFDMLRYVRAEIASTKRAVLDLGADIHIYREIREKREEDLSTTQKIRRVLGERFDVFVWFRDKVLPPIVIAIVMALLYLAFQKP